MGVLKRRTRRPARPSPAPLCLHHRRLLLLPHHHPRPPRSIYRAPRRRRRHHHHRPALVLMSLPPPPPHARTLELNVLQLDSHEHPPLPHRYRPPPRRPLLLLAPPRCPLRLILVRSYLHPRVRPLRHPRPRHLVPRSRPIPLFIVRPPLLTVARAFPIVLSSRT